MMARHGLGGRKMGVYGTRTCHENSPWGSTGTPGVPLDSFSRAPGASGSEESPGLRKRQNHGGRALLNSRPHLKKKPHIFFSIVSEMALSVRKSIIFFRQTKAFFNAKTIHFYMHESKPIWIKNDLLHIAKVQKCAKICFLPKI